MRFMVLVKATPASEAGVMPTTEMLAKMGAFNEGLAEAGVLLAGEGLGASSRGARLRFDDGRTTVTDGPFAETKDLVAGFWMVAGENLAEVVERFKRAPFAGGEELEIRPLLEPEDFGDAATAEIREREARLRDALA